MATRPLSRHAVADIPLLRQYAEALQRDPELRSATAEQYLSQTVTFVLLLAESEEFCYVSEEQEVKYLELARAKDFHAVHRGRDSSLTATVLTLSVQEVRKGLKHALKGRTLNGIKAHVSAAARFFLFLEREELLEENVFECVRRGLVFKVDRFMNSIDQAGR